MSVSNAVIWSISLHLCFIFIQIIEVANYIFLVSKTRSFSPSACNVIRSRLLPLNNSPTQLKQSTIICQNDAHRRRTYRLEYVIWPFSQKFAIKPLPPRWSNTKANTSNCQPAAFQLSLIPLSWRGLVGDGSAARVGDSCNNSPVFARFYGPKWTQINSIAKWQTDYAVFLFCTQFSCLTFTGWCVNWN